MAEKKKKVRAVTLYIPEGQTLKEYMRNARAAFFEEEELRRMMSEPQIPFGQILKELEEAQAKEDRKRKSPGARAARPAKKKK